MKRKHVFNADDEMYFGTLIKAVSQCVNEGFRFILFNDIIYFVDYLGRYTDSGLRKTDLVA